MITDSFHSFADRLEGIHGDVHNQIGGFMPILWYSAFDPIFWLHHNNVDRLLAIWQAANPGKIFQSDDACPTFQRLANPGDRDTNNTPLYPFRHADGSWWTSNEVNNVRNIWNWGFGYPEVPCNYRGASNTQLDAFATSKINSLYKAVVNPKKKKAKRADDDNQVLEWNVNIVVDQAELTGTFAIVLFLGEPSSDPNMWNSCTSKIGSLTVLGNPGMERMSKIMTGTIPITPILQQRVNDTQNEAVVNDFLSKNLVWKCLHDGQSVDVETMPTLKVGVTNSVVLLPTEDTQKATYGAPKLNTGVTARKTCGVTNADQLANPMMRNGHKKQLTNRFRHITTSVSVAVNFNKGLGIGIKLGGGLLY
ncbi:Tyrosinase [Arthrobotrys entomopaga]|nr:Tyrosinase [Arthrobotrys entomopaga]